VSVNTTTTVMRIHGVESKTLVYGAWISWLTKSVHLQI